jgi:hypothetical protein
MKLMFKTMLSVLALGAIAASSASAAEWKIQETVNPGTGSNWLRGVSCVSTDCLAVGSSSGSGEALAELWNGTKWAVEKTALTGYLDGVSCISATSCIAAGEGGEGFVAATWNGATWTHVELPAPKLIYKHEGQLEGISCTSSTACTAVGWWYAGLSEGDKGSAIRKTLAERWNGTTWSLQEPPNEETDENILEGVSCISSTECMAVGYSYTSNGHTLAERWNGTTWSIQKAASTGRSDSYLSGVSCTAATACTAVGYGGGHSLLAERWNGTEWSLQTTPEEKPAPLAYAVSCASATACTTAGAAQSTLAWNGTEWLAQTLPLPKEEKEFELEGVSCTASTACTAVGHYDNAAGKEVTVAERYE